MAVQVIESHLRCPRDGKRLIQQIGQDDATGAGDMRATHECWTCGYTEDDRAWSRPLKTDGESAARARLNQLRDVEIPLVYDDVWPEVADA